MSKHFYNPFMISVDFTHRLARGGGGGAGGADGGISDGPVGKSSNSANSGLGNAPAESFGGGERDTPTNTVDSSVPDVESTAAETNNAETNSAEELSAVESILVSDHGWSDNGDGSLTNPYGGLYDYERGGSIKQEEAIPDVETVTPDADVETVTSGGIVVNKRAATSRGALNDQLTKVDPTVLAEQNIALGSDDIWRSNGEVMYEALTSDDIDISNADKDAIATVADVQFLAQTSGANSTAGGAQNKALQTLGIDPINVRTAASDSDGYFEQIQKLADARTLMTLTLQKAGYTPGTSDNYYKDAISGPKDNAAKVLYDRYQQKPTEEQMIAAGLDPADGYKVIRSNAAEGYYANEKLQELGLESNFINTTEQMEAVRGSFPGREAYGNASNHDFYNDAGEKVYTYNGEKNLDIFEWDLTPLEKAKQGEITYLDEINPVTIAAPNTGPTVSGTQPRLDIPEQVLPRTVRQQVTPPTYFDEPFKTDTTMADQMSATFTKDLQTSGKSAVPKQVTYKTNYAGTPNLIDPNLNISTGGFGGTQQVPYGNDFGNIMMITEVNGVPITYVPFGYRRLNTQQSQQQQTQQQEMASATPSEPQDQSQAQADPQVLGNMINAASQLFFNEGGQVADPMLEAKYRIATMNGYNGPKTNESLNAFANASQGMTAKFRAIGAGMAQGGVVPKQAMIAGQPHRLAYVNPQEEAMMKAAGGTGAPSYGGIPAYFTLGPADAAGAGATVTDPTTGTVYTSDGTGWTMGDGQKVGSIANTSIPESQFEQEKALRDQNLIRQTMDPRQANVQFVRPDYTQFVPVDAGQATPIAPYAEAAKVDTVQQSVLPTATAASTMQPVTAYQQVQAETDAAQAAQGQVAPQAQATAAQQQGSSVTGLQAAQGEAYLMSNPVQREIQQGELISGSADAQKAAQFTEQVQAAEATPSKQATVQGQLEVLMQQFEGGETPAWAAGSMRNATAMLAQRGLGASSMAGQAIIQATMEAALPIAQMDAQITSQFESQNLSNRQQRAMLAAQQRAQFIGQEFDQAFQARVQNSARIGDIANMNFTADQNIALENSRAVNTMNLNNLSNRQAMVMSEAAALANLDMANLNNRQQTAVQNAQNFLQMDMQNLSNEQQTMMFKAQQNVQSLFTDQAAENAALQFNASSENQTKQFFANLSSQTSQFNASQQNAMDQFNVNSVNALREFNSEIQQQRDLFNAQNGLVIAQSNAKWRQSIATLDTAAQNDSNMLFAKEMNDMTALNLDAYWQTERDIMSYAFQTANNNADRATTIFKQQLVNDTEMDSVKAAKSASMAKAAASIAEKVLFG